MRICGNSLPATALWSQPAKECPMFRILLLIALVAVGYDAVVHQGAYTRGIWSNMVGLTNSAVSDVRDLRPDSRAAAGLRLD